MELVLGSTSVLACHMWSSIRTC